MGDVATFATGLFAGGALYVTLVEHPARVACGSAVAVTQFRPSYGRGAALQAPLAAIASIAAVVAWLGGGGAGWLGIAGAMSGVVVFTLVVILPTNKALLDERLDVDSPATQELLRRWGALHAVRTIVGVIAFVCALAIRP